jgi:hypothetical protein
MQIQRRTNKHSKPKSLSLSTTADEYCYEICFFFTLLVTRVSNP